MKYAPILFFALLFLQSCAVQEVNQHVYTSDIDNFWQAYDQIKATHDSSEQYRLLHEYFLDQGTPGLEAIRDVRRYSPESYLNAINDYPLFWESIRANTLKAKDLGTEMEAGIEKLKDWYPTLSPASIYFTIGAFRTNGTTLDSMVLIGSELAMADPSTNTSEFPENMGHLKTFFSQNPIENIVFLNVHEYIHTQQKSAPNAHLLTQCLREGVAEFIAEKATGETSTTPAIAFGKANDAAVKERFAKEMFSHYYQNWLWSNLENEFKIRDLGYYIGYAIAEKYYAGFADKKEAIANLIELDYADNAAIESFVEATGYFTTSVENLKQTYASRRPEVIAIEEFQNGEQSVDPGTQEMTIVFSRPMDTRLKNLRVGPLGEAYVLPITDFLGFSEDGTSIKYKIELEPNRQYQLLVHDQFRSKEGVLLPPYLIDIRTGE